MRIFIVDDNVDFAESLGEALELEGYEVETAHSAEDAIAKFDGRDFDLTFLDMKMPGMNGVECFKEIRKKRPNTRAVIMTGFSVEDLKDQAMQSGVLAVLEKPLRIDRLLNMVENLPLTRGAD
jgi:DNA-binding NtrC family response regulator